MLLGEAFFLRPTPEVARDVLGMRLVHRLPDGSRITGAITETEAYHGHADEGSHAHRGRTPRNAIMFGPPGFLYLYLCYGMHWMLNITTCGQGFPAAVLIRGTDAVSGPGRLTRHFALHGRHNGLRLGVASGIWIAGTPGKAGGKIRTTPRVGIDYAGPRWRKRRWRFVWQP